MSKKELDRLYLSKNERLGVFILFMMLLALIIIPWLYNKSDPVILIQKEKGINTNDKFDKIKKDSAYPKLENTENLPNRFKDSKPIQHLELFDFDPNGLNANDASRLGISDKTFRTLQKYLATGAKIKSAQQFSKIYGIEHDFFNKLEPHIKIKNENGKINNYEQFKINNEKSKMTNYEHIKSKFKTIIDLNSATVEDMLPLPGIGEKLATRIIKYRNVLGGFTQEDQLHEVFGLQDSTILKFKNMIRISDQVNKLKLNRIDYATLSKHPYFGFKKAKVICEYRKQHKSLNDIQDLYKIESLDSSWIQKVSPYLSFEK